MCSTNVRLTIKILKEKSFKMNDISLSYLLKLSLSKIWAIVIAAVVFAVSAFCYFSFAATPSYQASGSLLSTNGAIISQNTATSNTSKVSGSDITSSLYLSYTIADILNTSDIFKEVAEATGGKYKYTELMSRATVAKRDEDTLFIDVSFTANTPEEATELVNTFLSIAPEYINKFVPDSTTSVTSTADGASLVYPKTIFSTIVFALLGAILAFVVVFIFDSLDHAIKNEDDFKAKFDLPLLGVIPNFENTGIPASKGGYDNVVE